MPSKKIVVIGCGWLGLPLAKELVAFGHSVIGTTTTADRLEGIGAEGIEPRTLEIISDRLETSDETIWEADVFIVAIPPRVAAQGTDFHISQMRTLLEHIPASSTLIYISSTSVYPPLAGNYRESFKLNLENTGNTTLYQAEQLISGRSSSTIVRCGGLMGEQRISGRYFAGKDVSGQHQPVNYIHQVDAVGLICRVVEKELEGVYNLVTPLHPTRAEVYAANSKKFGFVMPTFKDDGIQRIIDGNLIADKLNYTFQYPDPRDFHS
ncbi:MAG: SDR family NAD(P)-dependent oxidoreductase [Cyclobacteriaceae bacterium]